MIKYLGNGLDASEEDVASFKKFFSEALDPLIEQLPETVGPAARVREFTSRGGQVKLPETPRPMNRREFDFLTKMIMDELIEMARTVVGPSDESPKDIVRKCLEVADPRNFKSYDNDVEAIAEQADGMIDIYYYMADAAAKVGMRLDDVFDEVHTANMRKRFDDGTFHTVAEGPSAGKVIKPPGFQEANVVKVVERWFSGDSDLEFEVCSKDGNCREMIIEPPEEI